MRLGSTVLAAALMLTLTSPANALSELKPAQPADAEQVQVAPPPLDEPTIGPDGGLPQPDPIIRETPQSQSEDSNPDAAVVEDQAPADIITDLSQLPEPARRMRELILEAAATGDPEKLRALLGTGPNATQLAFSQIDADAVEYLRTISGDGEGQEILAILIDLLNTGFVRIDAGGPNETFVWPYFVALPLDSLTAPQKVELLRLVTAGDVEDMKAYGAYNFYRVGISPDGEWRFFMAGD
ncbi:hypothetical protein WNZ14_10495 [Hoeflea sp. AS60]|uniref:hypothetical protein n=1 Tax=Hoeflea sp. AS60 TaxID=3135780 RepID=UPI0031765EB1